jgi:mRNA degradation ribonuclease J1/J2
MGSCVTIEVLKLYNNRILDIYVKKVIAGKEYIIPNCKFDTKVIVQDANHCPGALMFCFKRRDKSILYTGDFRLNKTIEDFAQKISGIDIAYIDTTYSNPEYNFMSQESAIVEILEIIKKNIGKRIYLGLYTLGKNKIVKAIYEELKIRTYVSDFMRKVFKIIGWEKAVTINPDEYAIISIDLKTLWDIMNNRKEKTNSIYIIPTGWVQSKNVIRNSFYLIPYSEHCDYYELQRFLRLLKPKEFYPLGYFKGW